MPLLPPVVLLFALASLSWFSASFAVLAQGIVDGAAGDQAHAVYGYGVAAVQVAVIAGWLCALLASVRTRSILNGPVLIMCGATAVAQLVIVVATVALLGRVPSEIAKLLLGHAVVGGFLAIRAHRSMRRAWP